jgi:hypothetical protein
LVCCSCSAVSVGLLALVELGATLWAKRKAVRAGLGSEPTSEN